jgi:hypothetical protein
MEKEELITYAKMLVSSLENDIFNEKSILSKIKELEKMAKKIKKRGFRGLR